MLSLQQGIKVGPWTIKRLLGHGEYGSVYSVVCDRLGREEYALKVTSISKQKNKNQPAALLIHEISFFRTRCQAFMKDRDEIPHFPHGNGLSGEYICGISSDKKIQYLAMEKLDTNLSQYLIGCGGKMSRGDAYCVAARCIQILKYLRERFIIFNDIKSDNFMMRKTPNGYQLVILDFGAAEVKAKGVKLPSDGQRGTPLFASINSLKLGDMYYSDDLAAVGYMIAYLLLGDLPWSHAKSVEEVIAQKEKGCQSLIKDYDELAQFMKAFEKVNTDNIDYDKWIRLFSRAAAKYGNQSKDLLLPILATNVSQKKKVETKEVVAKKVETNVKPDMEKESKRNPKRITKDMKEVVAKKVEVNEKPDKEKESERNPKRITKDIKEVVAKKAKVVREQTSALVQDLQRNDSVPLRIQPHRSCKQKK